jgi:hypothetical protein
MTGYKVEDVHSFIKIKSHWVDHYNQIENRIGIKFTRFHTDQSGTIEYRLNDYGYRSDIDYEDFLFSTSYDDYILGIGDSNTEGIGVNVEDTWLEKLGKMIGVKTVNFGLTSGTVDYCNYQLTQLYNNRWDDINLPLHVFVLVPPKNRWSIISGEEINFFQSWNFEESGKLIYQFDNVDLANDLPLDDCCVVETSSKKMGEEISEKFGKYYTSQRFIFDILQEKYNFFKLNWDDFGIDFPKSKSDKMHFNEIYHEKIAREFYKLVWSKNPSLPRIVARPGELFGSKR